MGKIRVPFKKVGHERLFWETGENKEQCLPFSTRRPVQWDSEESDDPSRPSETSGGEIAKPTGPPPKAHELNPFIFVS